MPTYKEVVDADLRVWRILGSESFVKALPAFNKKD
jgi:hypothetical protein